MGKKLRVFFSLIFSITIVAIIFQNCSRGMSLNGSLGPAEESSKLSIDPGNKKISASIRCPEQVGVDVSVLCVGFLSGGIYSSEWMLDGQSVKADLKPEFISLGKLDLGSHTVSASFFDPSGAKFVSPSVTILVSESKSNKVIDIACQEGDLYVGESKTCVASFNLDSASSSYWTVNGNKVEDSKNLTSYTWPKIAAGTYLVQMIVVQSGKTMTSSSVSIQAKEPRVDISCPQQAEIGSSITCSASVQGPIQSGYWTVDGKKVEDSLNMSSYTWQNVPAGTYQVQGSFKNLLGNDLKSNTQRVLVSSSNTPNPTNSKAATVSIQCPTDPLYVGQSATCAVSTTGTIVSGYWMVNGQKVSESSSTVYTWKNIPAGVYSVQATVIDATGKATTSSAVSVTVIAPQVKISCPLSIAKGSSATCSANVQGPIGSGFWNVDNVKVPSSDGMATYTWKNVPEGTYEVHGSYTDLQGKLYKTNSVVVTVATSAQTPSVVISCPSLGYAGDSIRCQAFLNGASLSGGWKVNGAILGKCENQVLCDWGPTDPGFYSVQGYVTDPNGSYFISEAVQVVVSAPSVSITCPTSLKSGDSATCSALVVGSFQSGYWTINGQKISDSTNMASYSWTNIPSGVYTVQGVLIDKKGNSILSNSIHVIVADPSVSISCPSLIAAGGSGTCSATVSGNVSSGYWVLIGKDGTSSRQAHCDGQLSCKWETVAAGEYQVQGVIVDKFGKEFRSSILGVVAK